MSSTSRFCYALSAAFLISDGCAHAARPIDGAAASRLELVGFPLGPDAFARTVAQHRAGRRCFSTPPGRCVVIDKDRDHKSTIYTVAMPFFMRLNCRDFGLHQSVVESPPASHGCIRLPSDATRKLFTELPVGMLVSID